MAGVFSDHDLDRAVAIIRRGGVVAFPTETYYGLAVDPFNDEALARIFALKQRPAAKPLLVLISAHEQISLLVREIPPLFAVISEKFWPGPLTLVLPGRHGLSDKLTGGTGTIGLRISSCELAQRFVSRVGVPITATSANLSGLPPAVDPDGVRKQFGDRLDLVLEGGITPGGLGSTVVGLVDNKPVLIRPGVVDYESIVNVLS